MSDPTEPQPTVATPKDLNASVASGTDEITPNGAGKPKFAPPTESGEVGRLGPYRVVKELGKGGMGAVYAAIDARLDRRLALKVMLPEFATNPAAEERFLREARAAAKITHDNVVTVYEKAWTCTFRDEPIRVEAAGWRGKPVSFRVVGSWTPPDREAAGSPSLLTDLFFVTILTAGTVLAARNVWTRRADLTGAKRLGLAIAAVVLISWVFVSHHTASPSDLGQSLRQAFGVAAFTAALTGLAYLAIEPPLRRRWPWRVTAWNRLLAGRVRDPLIGRDVLVGLAAGFLFLGFGYGWYALMTAAGTTLPPGPRTGSGDASFAADPAATAFVLAAHGSLSTTFGLFTLALLLQIILRRPRLSWPALFVLMTAVGLSAVRPIGDPVATWASYAPISSAFFGLTVFVMARFGVLATVCMGMPWTFSRNLPLTWDPSVWYFGYSATGAGLLLALAAWGFYTATGGRLFKEGFFGDD